MLNQAEFTNFQGHKYTLLDFSPGVNVIKGRTHSGKSSLMRGIQWCLENKPRGAGDKYRRDFTKPSEVVSVALAFSEETFISREKDNKRNCYLSSEHKDPFLSLRTDVPDEIKEVTKLKPHNFQSQKDKYFLISKTPGQVASELNKVVGLKIIDEKASKINSIHDALLGKVKVLKEQIISTEGQLESGDFISAEELEIKLKRLNYLADTYDSDSEEVKSLAETLEEIGQHEKVVKRYTCMAKTEKLLPGIKAEIRRMEEKEKEVLGVQSIFHMAESWGAELDQANKIISVEPLVSKLRKELDGLENLERVISEVSIIEKYIDGSEEEITKCEGAIIKGESKLMVLEIELEKLLEYCTKCGAHKRHWRKES